jgi:transposase
MSSPATFFLGVDGGARHHQLCLLDPAGEVLGEARFGANLAGLAQLRAWLASHGPAEALCAAIERPAGPLVAALLDAGLTVWAINPKQLDRFRDRFNPAGAKDDRLDARVLADSLRTDPRAFGQVRPAPGPVETLRGLERLRAQLVAAHLAVGCRLAAVLEEYFPAALELLDGGVPDRLLMAVLEVTCDPAQARRVQTATWARILAAGRFRRLDAAGLTAILRQPSPPLAPGVVAWGQVAAACLVAQWRLLDRQRRQVEGQIKTLLAQLTKPDPAADRPTAGVLAAVQSMPGVGPVIASTLVGEAWDLLVNRDTARLRAQAGVAPVTRQSGRTRWVLRRRACNPRLREAVYHWARLAVQRDQAWRARYAALRAKGHRHARSLRTIADRLLRLLLAMLRDGTTYDPARLGSRSPDKPNAVSAGA